MRPLSHLYWLLARRGGLAPLLGGGVGVGLLLLCSLYASAEPPHPLTHKDSVYISHLRRRMEVNAEYLAPYDASRLIRTVTLNAYPCIQMFEKVHLTLGAGITATYAWGTFSHSPYRLRHLVSVRGFSSALSRWWSGASPYRSTSMKR